MGEREKLEEAAERAKRMEIALREDDERRAYEYRQQRDRNFHDLRQKLEEMSKDYAPKMRLRFTESVAGSNDSFIDVSISGTSTALRKPFASFRISATGSGFWISDTLRSEHHHRYQLPVGPTERLEKVAEAIRGVAVNYLSKKDTVPYEFPEWYAAVVAIAAFLLAAATWGLLLLLGGWVGLFLGWIPAWLVFHLVRKIGPVAIIIGVAGYAYYFVVEGSKVVQD